MRLSKPEALAMAAPATTPAAGPDSAVRAGSLPRGRGRHDAAVRLDDVELAGKALRLQLRFELADVGGHDRLQIGVDRRRRGALELADFGQHLVRSRDEVVGPDLAHGGHRATLVIGVGVGVDEGDGDARRALVQKIFRRGPDLGRIDRSPDAAVGQRTFVDLDAHVAVGDREEVAPQAPGAAAVAPAHFQYVAKAARGDDADLRPAAFEQGVGADGGAVHDRVDACRRRRAH